MGLIKSVIVEKINFEEVDREKIVTPFFKNPEFSLYLEDRDIKHLIIYENDEEVRIKYDFIFELKKVIDEKNDKYIKISGIDEDSKFQEFYLFINEKVQNNFYDEILFKYFTGYEELKKLCDIAEKASSKNSKEYKDTIEKNIEIFKELAKM